MTLLNITSDTLFSGQLRLLQPGKSHRAGTDAVLLAAACPEGARIADLGAGVGTVGLRAAQMQPGAAVVLIEQNAEFAALARKNAQDNGLSDRVEVVEADALAKGFALAGGPCDVVLTNPPFDMAEAVRHSPVASRAAAHVLNAPFEAWLKAALRLMRGDGTFVMIHRADALPRILDAAKGRLGAITVLPVLPSAERAAHRILIKGKRGSKAPFQLLPPLILHGSDGHFTPEATALHNGEGRIKL